MPQEFLISIAIFATMTPVIFYLNRKSRNYGVRLLGHSERMNRQLLRSVKNLLYLKILGIEQAEKELTEQEARVYYKELMHVNFYYASANILPTTFTTLVVVFLFYHFSVQGASTPDLLTLFYLLYRFAGSFSQTVSVTNSISAYKPHFDKILSVLEVARSSQAGIAFVTNSKKRVFPADFRLQAEKLSYSYDEDQADKLVLNNLNIDLPTRQLLVVKGASGSGKTTLLMVLIGVMTHSSGRVRWGGMELEEMGSKAFRSKIGYMGPEPYIIRGSAMKNLSYGLSEQPSLEEMWAACREAEAEVFLKEMKDGLDTPLSEQGEGLSMGQKQRLGLARALLRRPEVLILDEITANLDSSTEKQIIRNIAKMKSKMTILVSTHSAAFDDIADQILELGEEPTYSIKTQTLVT